MPFVGIAARTRTRCGYGDGRASVLAGGVCSRCVLCFTSFCRPSKCHSQIPAIYYVLKPTIATTTEHCNILNSSHWLH